MTNKYITIDGFEQLSKQQLFDMSAAHILKTGVQSTRHRQNSDTPVCSYSGTGCAAAPFIKEEYRERADDFGSWCKLVEILVPCHEPIFISKLQYCHDRYDNREDSFLSHWLYKMEQLAEDYKLDACILTKGTD